MSYLLHIWFTSAHTCFPGSQEISVREFSPATVCYISLITHICIYGKTIRYLWLNQLKCIHMHKNMENICIHRVEFLTWMQLEITVDFLFKEQPN